MYTCKDIPTSEVTRPNTIPTPLLTLLLTVETQKKAAIRGSIANFSVWVMVAVHKHSLHSFRNLSQHLAKFFSRRRDVSVPCADDADRQDLRDSGDRSIAQPVSHGLF